MLNEKYLERMKLLLKEEFDQYIKSFDMPRQTALRLNTKKCNTEALRLLPFECEPVNYSRDSYYFSYEKPGNLALHHAGAFYVQEPSSMMPVSIIDGLFDKDTPIKVLDACASPGGKTSQAVCCLPDNSVVISNEIVPSRCKTLVGNIERQGFKSCIVLNCDTYDLSKKFQNEFDLVICDAPCSGEGMLRKSLEARREWSEENVLSCAKRQKEILDNLAETVSEGGYLLYSTCTFSTDENEENVSYFLEKHRDFSPCLPPHAVISATSGGIYERCRGFDNSLARRFYPHKNRGEGQFAVLFRKNGVAKYGKGFSYDDCSRKLNAQEQRAVEEFLKSCVGKVYPNIRAYGDNLVILTDGMKIPDKKVFSAGVKLGEYKNGRIIPHHQLFSAYGADFQRKLLLDVTSPLCEKYLHGESIECDLPNGWAAVLINGIPLGGGKVVDGVMKNHYPKGLRKI